ncbi:hypothetical protein M408DRAFT_327179 [Serendipita vermifera MAFF 305830]|uniref:GED domain-containing protein n=1 Tax=Serendipita vermifera MAFF 305830 TaxID=933852 RepID=A0A0C2X0A4_SERVB|nr:hypothetical protein M408DRAFT_327179 [Serendipita vermifera MAFF 305830]
MTSESSLTFSDDAFVGGLSNRLSTQYRHRRAVLDLVDNLHSHGLQGQLDLPQIAVVGSQSVGKSSLIESISGITLPRAKGTCTRCPIECRLSRTDSPWSCHVYLRLSTQMGEIPFGPAIFDKSEVQDRIRRAQLAILNPSKPSADFLGILGDTDGAITNQMSFSSDLVSVRISGKEVDDLSFVDLPGIIASVREGGNEGDIEEVKNLVMNIIKRPSCLILLVVSCETDLENQGARRLAKQVDPSGKRTIPVLTKPDRIAAGEHTTWVGLLSNEQERFRHGWHCVKQANQQQLDEGISWQQARDAELDFFETTAPWIGLDENVKSRLGTQFLTDSLGKILFELICKRLPDIFAEVERKVSRVNEDLSKFPKKPTGDPIMTIHNMVELFKKDVELLVKGRPNAGKAGLIQSVRRSKEAFREEVFKQAPDFKPFDKPTRLGQMFAQPESAEDVVDTDEEALEPQGRRNKANVVYLDEVLERTRDAITRELPNHNPYAVSEYFIARFTAKWPNPAQKLFESMKRQFLKELKALITTHFSNFTTGGLQDAILRIVTRQLEACSNQAQKKMQECIALEHEEPATVNEHYLADYKRKYQARYSATRHLHKQRGANLERFIKDEFRDTNVMADAVHNLHQMGFEGIDKDKLLCLLPPDEADEAIEIMSEVRAYYQVAFKRFVDNIPMILDFELLKGFNRTISNVLFKELEMSGKDADMRSSGYLEEDPTMVRRREALEQDLQRLEAALADLQNIPGFNSSGAQEGDEEEGNVDLAE